MDILLQRIGVILSLLLSGLASCSWSVEQGTLCPEYCYPEQTICGPEGGVMTCIGPDQQGCTFWSDEQACGVFRSCQQGQCLCDNPCEQGESRCVDQSMFWVCEGPDEYGCLGWGPQTPCPQGLSCIQAHGECLPDTPESCYESNECDYVGQKLCMNDTKYRQCKLGYDGCLVWDCST